MRAFGIVEVTAFYETIDPPSPIVPERHEGIDSGFQLSLDLVQAHFVFDAEGMPTIIDGRARGLRLKESGGELVYADDRVHWMDLDIGRIPEALNDVIGQMRASAGKQWQEIRGAQ